ncbi:oligosaccharyltransferase complex subunit alpha (ribophorin I) [Kwoniella mangroviensis CBS 8886]|nr:oligosaccharyltransferase complex subunit alpha (ribophorin I) [Kwoniella mangroviensis CBS 8886]
MWSALALTTLLPLAIAINVPQTYINTAIARTIELGGLTTQITTQYNIKPLDNSPGEYHLALAGENDFEPAWWEVSLGGKKLEGRLLDESPPTVAIQLGKTKKDEVITLSLTQVLAHTSTPLPAEIEQRESQYLVWNTNSTYVDSWYPTDVERVKIRAPHPSILSYSSVPETYTRDNTITKSGGTLTLGPFHSLPPTLGTSQNKIAEQKPFSVHYETKDPVIGIRNLQRSAEVSHWGANLNIQDYIELVNEGPKLKGHFSRLAHQQSKFHASVPAQILTGFTLKLPPTAHSPYYYDYIGNVSTSHFRQGSTPATVQKNKKVRTSPRIVEGTLELKPRYPILGGWNYSFTVGYDIPLGDVLKTDNEKNRKVLAVPFLTGLKDVVVDNAELKVILPEGASDVQVYTPFAVDSIEHSIHKTYLDTTGRYAITLKKTQSTENHAQNVYVTYHYPLSAQLQKPLTIASLVGSLFLLGMGLRRVNYSIEKK